MKSESWKRRIGPANFAFLTRDIPVKGVESTEEGMDGVVADVMTKLYELGWRGPETTPTVNPRGTQVLWPSDDGDGTPVLTSEGLAEFWRGRGHKWVLLRADQLCRSMAGPLAARLQEMLAAYEEQCKADGKTPMPDWADWAVFVGGENSAVDAAELFDKLSAE